MNTHSHAYRTFAKTVPTALIILTLIGVTSRRLLAQNTITLHHATSRHSLQPLPEGNPLPAALHNAERVRRFDFNPRLQTLSSGDRGDTLLLDLFPDARYKATVVKVARSSDGITGLTARIAGSPGGYCYISISDKGISVMAELPEHDARFFIAAIDGNTYLSHYKISAMQTEELGCADAPDHTAKKNRSLSPSADASPLIADDDLEDPVVVKLLFVYTPAAAQWASNNATVTDIDDLIDRAMQIANLTMANSGTGITFEIAYKHLTDYVEFNNLLDLELITGQDDGYMDEIHWLRQQHAADVVVFIPEVTFTGGVAWLLPDQAGRPDVAFALCRVQQSGWSHTVVHEIGHTMGCGHHAEQNYQPGPGLFSYSAGWRGVTTRGTSYSTVMTYESGSFFSDGVTRPRIYYFSSPDVLFEETPVGHVAKANNVLTLKRTKYVTSRYGENLPDLMLQSLSVEPGALSPAFNPIISNYTVNVAASVTAVTVSATANDPTAGLSGLGLKNLDPGINILAVTVTNGNASRIYSIAVIRGEPVQKDIPFAENFESPLAGWIFIHEGQENRWVAGSATVASGAKSIYISNNGGDANSYTITRRNVAHFFCDASFPATTHTTHLSFDWKSVGEYSDNTPWDFLEVRITDTDIIPLPGVALSGGTVVGRYYLSTDWQNVNIPLNTAYAGTTKRIVFSWINDDNTGAQPPAAIDNIRIYHPDASSRHSVTFDIRNQQTSAPVDDATITFAGITNPAGQYTFTDILTGAYDYTVMHDGYHPVSGTLTLAADHVQEVYLTTLSDIIFTGSGFVINNNDVITTARTVRLTYTFTGGTPAEYIASEQPDLHNATWLSYNPDILAYTLAEGDTGLRTVYTRLRNDRGETPTLSDEIYYLPKAPSLSITSFALNNGDECTANRTVTLNHTIANGSPVVYSVAPDPDGVGRQWLPYIEIPVALLPEPPGIKTLYFAVANHVDTSNIASDQITLYEPVTLDATLWPNPTKNAIQITMQHHTSSDVSATIYTLAGETCLSKEFHAIPFEIDLSLCPAGILLIKLTNGKHAVIKSIYKY
ncbi:MAG: M12 family metallo-peptidase [Prevotellaceae bacterium]|jgi:hypothetical protein|nr:M12 family metallo-peptidase [Prevotellaceae bacterium]